jgi:hypothetical protein
LLLLLSHLGTAQCSESSGDSRRSVDKIPKKVLQNAMVQKMVERVHEIEDAENAKMCLNIVFVFSDKYL